MANSNRQITAPVSLHADVYPVLGLQKTGTYYDIGYVNSNAHGQTNMWSRRKPVRYNTPAELTEAQWQAAHLGLQAPAITSWADVGADGEQRSTLLWQYLAPRPGTDHCRLTDWIGYGHRALAPWKAEILGSLDIGNYLLVSITPETNTGFGGMTAGDIRYLLGNGGNVYAGVRINNITQGTTELWTASDPMGTLYENGQVAIIPEDHGMNQRDVVEVFAFLSNTPGATADNITKYSALFSPTDVVYGKFTVGIVVSTIQCYFTFSGIQLRRWNIDGGAKKYFNMDGVIYAFTEYTDYVNFAVAYHSDAGGVPTTKFYLTSLCEDAGGGDSAVCVPTLFYDRTVRGSGDADITTPSVQYYYYDTVEDANNMMNGHPLTAIPIFSEVAMSWGSPAVGPLSNRQLMLNVMMTRDDPATAYHGNLTGNVYDID